MVQSTAPPREGPLLARLRVLGWRPGGPEHVTMEALGGDLATAAEGVCPDCGRVGLALLPMHAGRAYCGVLLCPCGWQGEF